MRNKAPLALMEQAIMALVFALAAALCLRAFVWSDAQSRLSAARDQAIIQAQSAAEVLKSRGGDCEASAEYWGGSWDGAKWTIHFDENWQQTGPAGSFVLRITPENTETPYLDSACVEVWQNDTLLTSLDLAWQEVERNG